jgi:hypothetical protein
VALEGDAGERMCDRREIFGRDADDDARVGVALVRANTGSCRW